MSSYSERLYEQFEKEQSSFHRWVIAALLLVTFYGLVFQPYLALLTSIYELDSSRLTTDERLSSTKKKLQITISALDRAIDYMGDASAYVNLYRDADSWIRNTDEFEQAYDKQSRIMAALRASLSSTEQKMWEPETIPNAVVIALLYEHRPRMMRAYNRENECFFLLEDEWVTCLLTKKRKPITERLSRERETKLFQKDLDKHTADLSTLEQRKTELSQAGIISTPLGTIKLAFHDLLSLVSFAALTIFSVLIVSVKRQLILRSTFQTYGPEDETNAEALVLTMPIWLEPYNSRIYNNLVFIALVVPCIVTLMGVWQLLSHPTLELAKVKINQPLFFGITALAGAVFIFHYVQLVFLFRRYQSTNLNEK